MTLQAYRCKRATKKAVEALERLRFTLTDENFPFFNRHPHHTNKETWAMWAERDVLAVIDSLITEYGGKRASSGGDHAH